METTEVILQMFDKLSDTDKSRLITTLNEKQNSSTIQVNSPIACPHCKSKLFVKNGSVKGHRRYKCKECNKSFGNFTGTVYSGIKKIEKFIKYRNILFTDGIIPLQTMCSKIGISNQTSFDWRHKLIGSIAESKEKFKDDTQIDDIWFSYSQKGRKKLKYSKKRGGGKPGDNNFTTKVITATDKNQTVMKVARIGRLTKSDIRQQLGDRFKSGAKLISDSHPSIVAFAKDSKLNHVFFKSKEHVAETGENVQFLNNLASRLKTMINRVLKGVSTKYLQNYVNWFSFSETNKGRDLNKKATDSVLKDKKAWDRFTNTERIYKNFIEKFSVRTYRCPVVREWKSNKWNYVHFAGL